MKRPLISNVCEWVKNSWQRVKSEIIVKSFKKCGISNALDGSEDDILYDKSDASSENNHEDDFSGSAHHNNRIPYAVKISVYAPDDGQKIARNMLS